MVLIFLTLMVNLIIFYWFNLPTRRNLEKLTSINDLDLFSLNTDSDINPDLNLI